MSDDCPVEYLVAENARVILIAIILFVKRFIFKAKITAIYKFSTKMKVTSKVKVLLLSLCVT